MGIATERRAFGSAARVAATLQFEYVADRAALLQKALVTFRAFSKTLPLEELPNTEQLAKEGVRRSEDAARLHNQFLNVVDESGDALRELRLSTDRG